MSAIRLVATHTVSFPDTVSFPTGHRSGRIPPGQAWSTQFPVNKLTLVAPVPV